jgi:hypothetical protein
VGRTSTTVGGPRWLWGRTSTAVEAHAEEEQSARHQRGGDRRGVNLDGGHAGGVDLDGGGDPMSKRTRRRRG